MKAKRRVSTVDTHSRLRALEGQIGVLRVLVLLHEGGGLAVRELLDSVDSSQGAIQRSVELLIDLDLIREDRMKTWPFRRELSLTDKGKQVARRVLEISNIIEGENRTKWPSKK